MFRGWRISCDILQWKTLTNCLSSAKRRRKSSDSGSATKKINQSSNYGVNDENKNENNVNDCAPTPIIIQRMANMKRLNDNYNNHNHEKRFESLRNKLDTTRWDLKAMDIRNQQNHDISSEYSAGPEPLQHGDLYIDDIDEIGQEYLKNIQIGRRKVKKKTSREEFDYSDSGIPISDIPCLGCGAKLQCQDPAIPGFVVSSEFRKLTRDQLRDEKCRRCYLMEHYNRCLQVECPADEFNQIMRNIRISSDLIMHIVDMTDFPGSLIRDLPELVGKHKRFFVVGNKIDLIPRDGDLYVEKMLSALKETCLSLGIREDLLRHVCVVSAKTGYGIEELITKLLHTWRKKGSVYLVGCTNAGKSTLFNRLVASDYCKSNVTDLVHRATVSIWPGTTMGVLKFPIIAPELWRLRQRSLRLADESGKRESDWLKRMHVSKYNRAQSVLTGAVGKTDFKKGNKGKAPTYTLGVDMHDYMANETAYELSANGSIRLGRGGVTKSLNEGNMTVHKLYDQMSESYWCYDTPGLINESQIINRLTSEELEVTLPKSTLQPRTFILKPGQVMFISGLTRIDYLQGEQSIYITLVTPDLPTHVMWSNEADSFYAEHIGTPTLGVPLGDSDRLNKLPSLIGRVFHIDGCGWKTSAVDVTLSSLGWVSITAGFSVQPVIRVYTVGNRASVLRSPSLLSGLVNLRGKRVHGTPTYRNKKFDVMSENVSEKIVNK